MKNKIRLAIVDDHQIVIDGLHSMLLKQDGFEIACSSTSPAEILKLLPSVEVDVLLTDVMMKPMNGVELSHRVHENFPSVKILALSMSDEGEMVDEMIRNDSIQGYVLKNIGKKELVKAIEKIAAGGMYFSEEILESLHKESNKKKQAEQIHLTDREIEIIRLIEKEKSNKEIASQLYISERTVETHRKNIFRKLETTSIIGIVKYAYEHKLI